MLQMSCSKMKAMKYGYARVSTDDQFPALIIFNPSPLYSLKRTFQITDSASKRSLCKIFTLVGKQDNRIMNFCTLRLDRPICA